MMEWQTGVHTCNKHEVTLQVVLMKQKSASCKRSQYLNRRQYKRYHRNNIRVKSHNSICCFLMCHYLQMSTMSQQSNVL